MCGLSGSAGDVSAVERAVCGLGESERVECRGR